MKKILVIEDKRRIEREIYSRIHGKTFGGCSKIDTQQAYQIIDEMFAVLADCELKDVVEIKTTVKEFYGGRLGVDLPELSKKIFKAGDQLLILVGKQKEEPDDQKS